MRAAREEFVIEPKEQLRKATNNCYELQLTIPENSCGRIHLFSDKTETYSLILNYDTEKGKIQLDRRNSHYPLNSAFGEIRESLLAPSEAMKLSIFVDQSICEIFINHGEKVLTANYYPAKNQNYFIIENNQGVRLEYYLLNY